MIHLTTPRLTFRQWKLSDFETIAEFFSTPKNAQFVGGVRKPEAAWRLMATYVGHYQLMGYSYLALEEKETGKLMGTVGLWKSDPWPEPELGYWLLEEGRGKGYGTEAGLAAVNYAKEVLKLPSLVSYIDKENAPSQKLALRLGAKYDSTINLLGFGDHQVFRHW